MDRYTGLAELPENPTIKDINAYKKKINWGEIPSFFHLISNAVAEAEGFITYGFDNAYKRITNRKNWNYELLGVDPSIDLNKVDHIEQLTPLKKPRICLYHVFNTNGYELLALPYVKDTIIDEYRKDDANMEFTCWDPSEMKTLVRISQLHKFIAFNIKSGDEADMALIIHAHHVVNKVVEMLEQEVDVCRIKGMTIKDAYSMQNANPEQDTKQFIASQIDVDQEDN